jgi:DNA-binding NarL/FixJ family response regulator
LSKPLNDPVKHHFVIADDHDMHRDIIKIILESRYPDKDILEASDYDSLNDVCANLNPEFVLLDVCMPGMNGLSGVYKIIKAYAKTKFLICSAIDSPILVRTMLAFGAAGYVYKSMRANELLTSIDTVLQGGICAPPEVAQDPNGTSLTRRQWEVLGLMCNGKSNKEIANALNISVDTIKYHISELLKTLHAQSRVHAISICSLTSPTPHEGADSSPA